MKYQLAALCVLAAATGWGSTPTSAAPVVRPALACSTQGFSTSRASVVNQTPDTVVTCSSAPVTCPPGSTLVQNGTDLGGHPKTYIGYDAATRVFFYSCAPIVKQPPPK